MVAFEDLIEVKKKKKEEEEISTGSQVCSQKVLGLQPDNYGL